MNRKDILMKKISIVLLTLCMLFASVSVMAAEPSGKALYPVYNDRFNSGWINGRRIGAGMLGEWQKLTPGTDGNSIMFQIGAGEDGDKAAAAVADGVMPCLDVDNSALQFWLIPYSSDNEWSVGLTCWGLDVRQNNTGYIGGFSAIYVPIADYADISEGTLNKWQLVTIPLSDIREKGVFDQYSDTQMTEFDWYRVSGIYVTATNRGYTKTTKIAALNDINVIRYLNEPTGIGITETANGGYVSWKLPEDAEGTVIYKDGSEIKRVAAPVTSCYLEQGTYELQSYGADMYSLKEQVTVNNLTADTPVLKGEPTVRNAKFISDNGKDILIWDDTADSKYYYIFRDGKLCARTSLHSAVLTLGENTGYKITVKGKADAGEMVTVMATDSTGGGQPYFEQTSADENGDFIFSFITETSPSDIKLNCGGNIIDAKTDKDISCTMQPTETYSVCGGDENEATQTVEFTSADREIAISECLYEDSDGNLTNDFYSLSSIEKLNVKIKNNAESKSAALIMGVYDSDNNLIKTSKKDIYLIPGEETYKIDAKIVPAANDGCTVKLFLWDGTGAMEPICKPAAIKNNKQTLKEYTLSVNEEDYQTIKGWGLSPDLTMNYSATAINNLDNWTEASEALYKDLGATMTRSFLAAKLLEDGKEMGFSYPDELVDIEKIRSAVEEDRISWKDVDATVAQVARSVRYGINDYIISMSSPPRAMLMYETYYWSDKPYYFLREDCVDLYCDVILKELDYITKTNGLPSPTALSLQNEPENGGYTPRYRPDMYKKMLVALRKVLNENGYADVKLFGPECSSYPGTSASAGDSTGIFSKVDREYADALDIIGVHSYEAGYPSLDKFDEGISQYANPPEILQEKDKWQTEYCVGDRVETGKNFEMNTAQKEFKILSADIGWGGNNVWYHWAGYYSYYIPLADRVTEVSHAPKDGEIQFVTMTLGYGVGVEYYKNKTYDMLQMIFKNVPAGSVVKRVTLSDNCTEIVNECKHLTDVVAFENGNSSIVALTNDSEEDLSFEYSNLKGTTAKCYAIVNGISSIADIGTKKVVDGKVKVVIPKDSIVLIKTQ